MLDTLKIISQALDKFDRIESLNKVKTLQEIRKIASVEPTQTKEPQSVCPVTKTALRASCALNKCKFWVDHRWTNNCTLNFMLNQQKERLTTEQVSLLYKKSPQRVESIYKRSFKIVQRHYLKELLRNKAVPQFTHVAGFCVACQSRLLDEELGDSTLALGNGLGYCSNDCKKAHPPAYFEIERFFEADFLRVVEVGSEVFAFFALEDLLGFQPNVLRNRLEKVREEATSKKKST